MSTSFFEIFLNKYSLDFLIDQDNIILLTTTITIYHVVRKLSTTF
ncbi:hypothetical protein LZ3411_1706 [Levilactobacillus zymae]|uniref:Uncharacterized protein n=1 Tax=Levilactobacillus zymae TaxID=267363 RepID=A0A1Y6JXT4_9LACO|nr:hypothetical protein LZ3411_1706 [Levilactobacillus zymae]